MQYVTMRVRKETQRKLKILAALLDESMLDVLERLVSQELERVQKGDTDASHQEDQVRNE